MGTLLIVNGKLVNAGRQFEAGSYIRDGRIEAIGRGLAERPAKRTCWSWQGTSSATSTRAISAASHAPPWRAASPASWRCRTLLNGAVVWEHGTLADTSPALEFDRA